MAEEIQVIVNDTQEEVSIYVGTPRAGVLTVTGDGVGGTATDVVMTFPTPVEISAVEEAPEDGTIYGRQDAGWVAVSVDDELTADELAAINGANTPSASNVFATMDDVGGGGIFEGNVWRPKILEGNTSTENAVLINDAINEAKLVYGVVILPAGVFNCRTINYDLRVKLQGQGEPQTQLISTHAEPLISYTSSTFGGRAKVWDMFLNGDDIGTIGLQVYSAAGFSFRNLSIKNFTTRSVDLYASLIGSFVNCSIRNVPEGVKAVQGSSSIGTLNANLITFRNCTFQIISDWAVIWDKGSSVQFLGGCDFEQCGTIGDDDTGILKATNMCPAGSESEGIGVLFDGCWGEWNHGTLFSIAGSTTSNTGKHIIRNSMFQYKSAAMKAVNFNGGELLIDSSNIGDGGITIVNGKLETTRTTHGAVTLQNASKWKKDNCQNLTGTVLNLANTTGDSYNYASASSSTSYTTINKTEGAFASCLVNAASEPTVTGATKIKGFDFAASTDLEMIVEVKNGAVRYFFLEL